MSHPIRNFLFLCSAPTLLVFVYTFFVASPMYISTARFAIKTLETGANLSGGPDLISKVLGASGSTTSDSYLISQYAHSWDIFSRINEKLDLKSHYSDRSRDVISRLAARSAQDDILDYWSWAVGLTFDPDTGIIVCRVKAYSPEMAWRINQLVIEFSESLLNDMNQRGRRDSLATAASEVKIAEERLSKAHAAMRRMREQTSLLSAQSAGETLQAVINNLEVEAAKTASALQEARAYMREDSPQVETLKRRLAAVQNQLEEERGKLSGRTGGSQISEDETYLSAVVGQLEDLQMEEEIAGKQYASAVALLEGVRIRNESQTRYLVAFEPPLLPDESLYPESAKATLLTFFGTALVFGLSSLIVAAIREHAGF
ncbi:MAG: capsule biosynthesis protein [Candidatus Adiutrix sp.]|jgi:capsular polysaccharide transport system permease protein|nr:capsule biosynthesis protein [Candidatus Adiutrix sp.]